MPSPSFWSFYRDFSRWYLCDVNFILFPAFYVKLLRHENMGGVKIEISFNFELSMNLLWIGASGIQAIIFRLRSAPAQIVRWSLRCYSDQYHFHAKRPLGLVVQNPIKLILG